MSDGQDINDAYDYAISESKEKGKGGEVLCEGREVHDEGHGDSSDEASHARGYLFGVSGDERHGDGLCYGRGTCPKRVRGKIISV